MDVSRSCLKHLHVLRFLNGEFSARTDTLSSVQNDLVRPREFSLCVLLPVVFLKTMISTFPESDADCYLSFFLTRYPISTPSTGKKCNTFELGGLLQTPHPSIDYASPSNVFFLLYIIIFFVLCALYVRQIKNWQAHGTSYLLSFLPFGPPNYPFPVRYVKSEQDVVIFLDK